jgi:hypothetical protein
MNVHIADVRHPSGRCELAPAHGFAAIGPQRSTVDLGVAAPRDFPARKSTERLEDYLTGKIARQICHATAQVTELMAPIAFTTIIDPEEYQR